MDWELKCCRIIHVTRPEEMHNVPLEVAIVPMCVRAPSTVLDRFILCTLAIWYDQVLLRMWQEVIFQIPFPLVTLGH